MATVGPTAMVFVPSIGGRSHVEVEETSWEDCEAGAERAAAVRARLRGGGGQRLTEDVRGRGLRPSGADDPGLEAPLPLGAHSKV